MLPTPWGSGVRQSASRDVFSNWLSGYKRFKKEFNPFSKNVLQKMYIFLHS